MDMGAEKVLVNGQKSCCGPLRGSHAEFWVRGELCSCWDCNCDKVKNPIGGVVPLSWNKEQPHKWSVLVPGQSCQVKGVGRCSITVVFQFRDSEERRQKLPQTRELRSPRST